MTHDEFITRCKELVEQRHRETCSKSQSEMAPALLVRQPGTDNVVMPPLPDPAAFMRVRGEAMEQIVKPILIMIGATHVGFCSETWMATMSPSQAAIDAWKRDEPIPSEFLPSNRPDRVEAVSIWCFSPGHGSGHAAPIIRSLYEPPRLKDWDDVEFPENVERIGQIGEPLRDAVREVNSGLGIRSRG